MRCSSCGADNPEKIKFCEQCGTALARRCAKCGFDNPVTARFCGECGAPLQSATTPPASGGNSAELPEAIDGERRHLTVLFSDLVNSTEIAAHLDPEDWRDIAADYQRSAAEAVTRLGGHVAKYLGDGVMVYFGWPEAHEDDAERAARAGLAIIDAVTALNARVARKYQAPKLSVRVGIDTGAVVMGKGGGKEADVFGDTPNIASRVQSAAAPDTAVITSSVHDLVSGLFVVEDLGPQSLKGIEHPVQLYRVIQPNAGRRRTHGVAARTLTPFVGRDDEMRLLLNRWERAREGEGQLALVVGEPGIGKSRLAEEFHAHIKSDPHLWIECAGEQFSENTPFHAVTQMLDQGLGWRGDESKEERASLLERSLELSGTKLAEAMPLIGELLNLPIPQKYPMPPLAPDQKRKRLLANLAAWVLNGAHLQPVVVAVEDVHWVDPSTLELMQMLVEQAATAPVMLLFTARPEFRASWPMRAHHSQITLSRLSDRYTREMIGGVAARTALTKDVIDTVVKRTDGVPLFAEELTRLMLEGEGRAVTRQIPVTLQDSLMARLDRLGPAKEVAQFGAVLGREFSYELLQAVSALPEADLQAALAKLTDAELIYARGIAPDATYQFKHALIQDTAYEALLKSRRRELNRHVAQTITERFPMLADSHPEVLARHWSDAGDADPAIAAWKKAGEAADARGALKEAEEDFRQALAILETLPESPERLTRELALLTPLSLLMQRTRGYAVKETLAVVDRARTVAEKTGNLAQLVIERMGAYAALFTAGDFAGADELAGQILDLARREGSAKSAVYAHAVLVSLRFHQGDLIGADEHLAQMQTFVGRIAPDQIAEVRLSLSVSFGYGSINAWMLGHADEARARIRQAKIFAADSKKPFNLCSALSYEGYLYRWLRESQQAAKAVTESIGISEEYGFSTNRNMAAFIVGWAKAQFGQPAEGIALIRECLSGASVIGARADVTNQLTILAEAQALGGQIDEALATLTDALAANLQELVFQPNILNWRGRFRLELGHHEQAETDFRQAIALSQKMRAKSFELRATTSLARLLAKQGKRDEAQAMLAEIYNWFTEGFDTADLKDAKALLEELAATA